MNIYLVRHGETTFNQEKRFYGLSDCPLNRTGRHQSQRLQKKLQQVNFDKVYVSELSRTQETAQLIIGNQDYQVMPAFNEKFFGLWEGLTANQIEHTYPREWQAWLAAPFDYTPPQAESFRDFQTRVLTGMKEIEAEDQQSQVLIVGHLGVLRLLDQYFHQPPADFWEIDYQQGCYTSYQYTKKNYQLIERNR